MLAAPVRRPVADYIGGVPGEEVVRITTAPVNAADELRQRQHRYLFTMAVRTACFVGAVAVGPGWLRWVLIAGAVFFPYVAVVMANVAARRRSDTDLVSAFGGHGELGGPAQDS